MTRRQVLRAGAFTAALTALEGLTPTAAAAPKLSPPPRQTARPNIILLVTDDQRADSLGCAGNSVIQTPHIDALAGSGVRFVNSFATTAICMTSRASILTGLHSRVHGVNAFSKSLADPLFAKSYPMLLRKAGYYTGFIGKWGIDAGEMPTHHYDVFQGYQGQGAYFKSANARHLTALETDDAIEFLRGCPNRKPFCLAVSFKAPHVQDEGRFVPGIYPKYPYDRSLDHLYANDMVPGVKTRDVLPQPDFLLNSLNGTREAPDFLPPTYQEALKDLYRLISGVDQAVGKIVAELKKLSMDDNTVIIYTSDHGSFYGEHGFGGKWLMHEESIRTPMIISDPRLPSNRRKKTCDQMVLNLDVPATVLEIAGIPLPVGMQGCSVMPLALGKVPASRTEWFYENHFRNSKFGPIAASEGIRTSDWKYIRYIDTTPIYEQLYDLKNDPREERNLAEYPVHHARLESMRDRWAIWTAALDRHSMGEPWMDPVS